MDDWPLWRVIDVHYILVYLPGPFPGDLTDASCKPRLAQRSRPFVAQDPVNLLISLVDLIRVTVQGMRAWHVFCQRSHLHWLIAKFYHPCMAGSFSSF